MGMSMSTWVKRKTSLTRVSIEALEKIEQLKKDSGKTSAQIIDDALKNHFDRSNKLSYRLSKAFQAMFDKASSNKGKLDKDDPTVLNAAKAAKELGITPEALEKGRRPQQKEKDISIPFGTPDHFHDFFDKLRREHRKAFMKEMQSNPKFTTLDNTKPPNAYIDACILSLWGKSGIAILGDYLRPRQDIIAIVKYNVEKTIDGTSWGQFHKAWFKSYGKYKGKFEQTIDSRIYALIRNKIIKPFDRGQYILSREFTDDEDKIIEGILRLQPQRGIVIPKII